MAQSRASTSPASRSYRRQALLWLMMALLLGVVTALVWMFSQTSAIGAQIENAPLSTPQVTVDELKQPLSIESLHELDTDVQPIDFEATVRDLRNYPDEFKDKRYLSANKGKWTVQVMNVAENDVIVSYLESRKDRDKFAYFRYRDENNKVRYMLTYGIMSSPQEAVGAAKLIDFGLPAGVRVLPEEISRYVSIIDNYERPEPIKDLSSRRARSVKLKRTQREVPVRQQPTTNDNDNAATEDSISADTIKQRAERNMANAQNDAAANSQKESIRQSEDTSATLSVNEQRSIDSGNENIAQIPSNTRNTDAEVKKPPVVTAPKPPTDKDTSAPPKTNNNNNNNNNATPKPANTANDAASNTANSNDSMKELIQERTN
ncbi:hypothetical protein [Psychrobacter submarinus]|uniref:hypothetical protein n=1 Tax=Psychrobacter submarinus TaxID=154108 RepID=UPI00191B2A66|nr:hypothetical protein [Psychrobacter submarinus]